MPAAPPRAPPTAFLAACGPAAPPTAVRLPPLIAFGLLLVAPGVLAQATTPARGPARNFAAPLHAEGTTLWIGPLLSVTRDGGATFGGPGTGVGADTLRGGEGRVFSLDVEGPVVWGGLYANGTEEGVNDGGGFVVSTDDGATLRYVRPPVDRAADSIEVVGTNRLRAYLNGDPTDARPNDLDVVPGPTPGADTVYAALLIAGLRRTTDGGRTWRRIVLPPDNLDELREDAEYSFPVGPPTATFPGSYNHVATSVLVDETGTLWAGTLKGLNRSLDRGRTWTRTSADGSVGRLTGSFVAVVEEQPLAGRNAVWAITRPSPDLGETTAREGLVVTRDGGATFEQALVGEGLFDVAFRGPTVYAAGARGLFVSDDGGRAWRLLRDLCDRTGEGDGAPCVPGLSVFAVAVTSDGAVWAGTADGLFKSLDGGETWRGFRAEVPLRPAAGEPGRAASTYAYPNPFSPNADRAVRFRYDARGDASVRIRIFDFAMGLVRTLDAPGGDGEREAAWDGFDADGLRVPNGPYFYAVEADGKTVRGKLLVID